MKKYAPHARLTVTGQGQAAAQPDMATITLGVTVQAATAAEAMTQNAEAQSAVIKTLKGEGIEARDIQTSGLNLSPVMDYSRDGEAPKLTGYNARNSVTVRVRDLAGLGGVLDKLVASGANEIGGIAFAREDMTEAQDQARADAVRDARHRAEIMAEAAGMRLGPLLRLGEATEAARPAPMMRMAAAESGGATPIEAGELTVTANVTAIFAMRPADAPPQEDAAPDTGDAPANQDTAN